MLSPTQNDVVSLLPSSRMTLHQLEDTRNKMVAATVKCAEFCGLRFAPTLPATQALLRAYAQAILKRKAETSKQHHPGR